MKIIWSLFPPTPDCGEVQCILEGGRHNTNDPLISKISISEKTARCLNIQKCIILLQATLTILVRPLNFKEYKGLLFGLRNRAGEGVGTKILLENLTSFDLGLKDPFLVPGFA